MARLPSEGEHQSVEERSASALWLVLGMAAILLGFPVGFVLVAGSASTAWFLALYVAVAVVAVVAAFGFMRVAAGAEDVVRPTPA